MADPFRSYRPGDPVPRDAGAFNAFAMAARFARDQGQTFSVGDAGATTSAADIVRVKNASGGALGFASILGVDSPVFTPSTDVDAFKREVILKGLTPGSSHPENFVVLLEPAADGRVVRAVVAGVCVVKIDVTNTAHEYAVAVSGDSAKLGSSGVGPAQILWRESGTGTKWAVVRIGTAPLGDRIGKITGSTISAVSGSNESSGTVRLYNRSSAGVRSDSGVDVTAWNPSNTSLPANAFVIVGKVDGLWTIKTRLDC